MIDRLAFFVAILVAGVAAFFSVIGLATIFSGAYIATIVMAGSLEIGKLVTATWLHLKWDTIPRWIRAYLTTAVAVLMLITSIGIFGYLSKAHLDQEGASGDAIAVVERVDAKILREENKISLLEERIAGIGSAEDVSDSIRQQESIRDGAWARVQGDIDYSQGQINDLRAELATLDLAINELRNKGVETITIDEGGAFRRAEVEKIDYVAQANELFAQQQPQRDRIKADIDKQQGNIDNYRTQAQDTINAANAEINRLRTSSADAQDANIQKVDDLQLQIDGIYDNIALLNDDAFEARQIVRDLELEVGPIKYVAQLIYGEANAEQYFGQAVRILILTIIFVFDPLAVLLLIATAKSWIIIVKNKEPDVKVIEKERVVYKEAVKGGHTQEEHWENLRREEEQWLDENAPPEPLTEKSQKWFKDLYNKFKTVSIDKKNIEDAEKNPPV